MNYIDISKLAPEEPEARKQWRRENFKRVTVSPKFVLSDVSDDETLRRFVDLPKLFDLLKNKRLMMPTLGELIKGDPFECFAKKSFNHLNRAELETRANQLEEYAPDSSHRPFYPPNLSAADFLTFRSYKSCFGSEIKEMTDEELRDAVWYLERERLKNDLVCSCWHKGTVESDAMWKIYAAQLGVSIGSSVTRMKSGVKMILPQIYAAQAELNLAAVHYETDTNTCQGIEPWLVKRRAFEHEKEVRLYCDVPFVFGTKFELEIEISTLIEEIVISPFVETWQVAGIKGAIETLLKEVSAGQIVVRQSKHMRAPQLVWPPATKTHSEDDSKVVVRPIIGEIES
jgi:hypothetical protein